VYPDTPTYVELCEGHTAELREWLEARGLGPYAEALLAQDIELDIQPWRKPCFANS